MWPGNGIGRSRPLLALALALVAAGLLPGELSAAKKAKAGLPALTREYRHPSGAFAFRTPETWEVKETGPETTEAWGEEIGFRFVYRPGESGFDSLHVTCMLERLAPETESEPQVRYEYDFVSGPMFDRRALDSAFSVRYDQAIRGHRDWRQRNLTVVGGGQSLCVISYVPAQLWKRSLAARGLVAAVAGSLTLK
ncbi:MAG TPA: hypothetical protein VJU18_00190 [Vicinamibacteria bacterium]|nr:hypothetical protein [Vicinamibacteria bacterium]